MFYFVQRSNDRRRRGRVSGTPYCRKYDRESAGFKAGDVDKEKLGGLPKNDSLVGLRERMSSKDRFRVMMDDDAVHDDIELVPHIRSSENYPMMLHPYRTMAQVTWEKASLRGISLDVTKQSWNAILLLMPSWFP